MCISNSIFFSFNIVASLRAIFPLVSVSYDFALSLWSQFNTTRDRRPQVLLNFLNLQRSRDEFQLYELRLLRGIFYQFNTVGGRKYNI